MAMLTLDELPEGTDVGALVKLFERFDRCRTESEVYSVLMSWYPSSVGAFRRSNRNLLGIEPATTDGLDAEHAMRAGFYKTRLRDGTDGYMMRRTDDCSTATVATLAGVHPSLVPDPEGMRNIVMWGRDPEQVLAELDDEYEVFAAKTGIRLRFHSSPPVWSKRWIAVVEKDEDQPLESHLMVMSGRDLLFDPAHIAPNDGETALEGWGMDDVSLGYTLDD